MKKTIFLLLTISFLVPVTGFASTKLGIGVFEYILSRTKFTEVSCAAFSCDYVSEDKSVTMKLQRANLVQHISKDLNFLLDVNIDSELFKSGLFVQYYNNVNLIRVYIKGSEATIEAKQMEDIATLQRWLKNSLSFAAKSS